MVALADHWPPWQRRMASSWSLLMLRSSTEVGSKNVPRGAKIYDVYPV